jgi:type III secretion protein V
MLGRRRHSHRDHWAARAAGLHGVGLTALIVGLLLCMLVPPPAGLVDLLLAANLAAAMIVLVASAQARRTEALLGFPRIVLLLTVARLVLNLATTRLILAEGHAGRVVDAFAELVVRGDLVIGAVMFAVITAIQYLVIARGAERIAEVAARFALDAMPGQQQAIDSDLRAGAIGPREAEARRASLVARAELYGRMDGIIRWVKCEAIVGVLLIMVNLGGGIAIGITRAGLGVGGSVQVFAKLAIGDGLLAQIPALLIAIAAALVVAGVEGGPSRARVDPHGRASTPVFAAAALLGPLALIPGMPTFAFGLTALGLIGLGSLLVDRQGSARAEPRKLRLRVGSALVLPSNSALAAVQQRCAAALGIAIPPLLAEPDGSRLAGAEVELRRGEQVLGRVRVDAHGGEDAVVLATYQLLMTRAACFVTLVEIEGELARCRARSPGGDLVRQATRAVEPIDLLAIVRGFVGERLPAPAMHVLLAALAEGRVFGDVSERRRWPEHARVALADHWVREVCDAMTELGEPCWIRPTVDLEEAIAAGVLASDAELRCPIVAPEAARLCARIRALAGGQPAIVVCSPHARPAFAAALAKARPQVPVLALGELIAADLELPPTRTLDLDM